MLFLYRPRETWMPIRLPRNLTQQRAYNRQLQERFDQTRQHAPAASASDAAPRDPISALKELAQLHDAGALTDEEFAAAKSKLLDADDASA
jgi:Short C-terminal domain